MSTRIAVDLTVPPYADANSEVLALLNGLRDAGPEIELLLLTSAHGAALDVQGPNVQRAIVAQRGNVMRRRPPMAWIGHLRDRVQLRGRLRTALAGAARRPGEAPIRTRRSTPPGLKLLREQRIDVMFCPFTAPGVYEPGLPLVAVVHDLQFEAYPEFLTSEDLDARRTGFADAFWLADRLVCSSEFMRRSVIDTANVAEERVVTIFWPWTKTVDSSDPAVVPRTLAAFGLAAGDFLLYPANFAPTKNHAMLFAAFGIFRARHPGSQLKLVCASEHDSCAGPLHEAIQRMGLAEWVIVHEGTRNAELSALFSGCRAVIYPSLYEASGLPILDALAYGRPLLCSNTTALPEVAQDAAVYFDPRRAEDIADAIDSVANRQPLNASVRAPMQRPDHTVEDYLALFREVAHATQIA